VRLLAVYTTMTRARQSLHALAMRYRLCPKLLGLEKTNRACFQTQLGKCDGACEGSEASYQYNERFRAAFERQRVVAWPYPGPVLIKEQHPGAEGSAGFVVDNWCLVARLREYEDGTVEQESETHRFDMDRYKIIKQFLEKPRNRRAVTVMPAEALANIGQPA
jgi:DNA polymerase-3 subunit epsilon